MPQLALFGFNELLIIGGIVLLIFGARKLPELARSMGSSVTQFKKGLKDEQPTIADSSDDSSNGESKD